jgi:hypothetical protein
MKEMLMMMKMSGKILQTKSKKNYNEILNCDANFIKFYFLPS